MTRPPLISRSYSTARSSGTRTNVDSEAAEANVRNRRRLYIQRLRRARHDAETLGGLEQVRDCRFAVGTVVAREVVHVQIDVLAHHRVFHFLRVATDGRPDHVGMREREVDAFGERPLRAANELVAKVAPH